MQKNRFMGKILLAGSIIILLIACDKRPEQPNPGEPHPQMYYKDLKNTEVGYQKGKPIDLDDDGSTDFLFHVLLLGDPILQRDRMQFYAGSGIGRNLLNDAQDQSPMLSHSDLISSTMPGYNWWEISAVVMAEKVITNSGSYWDGIWKNAFHKYLPIQMKKQGKLYHGWIELSFDTIREKLILHRSAISREEEKPVKAGY